MRLTGAPEYQRAAKKRFTLLAHYLTVEADTATGLFSEAALNTSFVKVP